MQVVCGILDVSKLQCSLLMETTVSLQLSNVHLPTDYTTKLCYATACYTFD